MEQVDSGNAEDTDGQMIRVAGSITLKYTAEDTPDTDGAGLDVHNYDSEVDLTVSNPGSATSYMPPFSMKGYFYYPAETGVCEQAMQYRAALTPTLDAREMAETAAAGLYLTDEYCLVEMLHLGEVGAEDNALAPGGTYPLERTPDLLGAGVNLLPYVHEEDAKELIAVLNNPLGVVLTTFSYYASPVACDGLPAPIVNHPDADVTSFPPETGENTLTATGPICQ
ncbi:hypothetical protein [Kocuria sp. CH-021]|uniref:hypothetical protein n=1 Tax=Kocuria sp. CH-021 TaxID=3406735 RepID=UPI003C70C972